MPNPFECPGCHVQLAYSAALRGRTVRCHYCGHSFPVADLVEAIVQPEPAQVGESALESPLSPPPLPQTLMPPPLPVRAWRNPPDSRPAESSANAVADRKGATELVDQPATESHPPTDLDLSDAKERLPTAGPVLGIIGVLLFGGLVMASGIGYLIWPGSSRQTAPAIPPAAPPVETPVEVEQPKSLREVLEGGGTELPPGPPKFKPGAPGPAPQFPQRK